MSLRNPETDQSTPPRLHNADLSFLDEDAEALKVQLVELLENEFFVNAQKIGLFFQKAVYKRVLIDDVFMKKVLNENFFGGVEDVLKIFRTQKDVKDKMAERLVGYFINTVKLAQEFLEEDVSMVEVEERRGIVGESFLRWFEKKMEICDGNCDECENSEKEEVKYLEMTKLKSDTDQLENVLGEIMYAKKQRGTVKTSWNLYYDYSSPEKYTDSAEIHYESIIGRAELMSLWEKNVVLYERIRAELSEGVYL